MNKYYKAYRESVEKSLSEISDEDRSFGEQLFAVFVCMSIGTLIIHGISFFAACMYPAYQMEVLFGSFWKGYALSACIIFLFIEVPKFTLLHVIFENYLKDRTKSYGMVSIVVVVMAISIASSTFGIEEAVKRLSPGAELVDLALINDEYDLKVTAAHEHWQPQIDALDGDAKHYWKTYAKYYKDEDRIRLTSSGNYQETYDKFGEDKQEAIDALNVRLDEIRGFRQEDISKAKAENETRKSNHKFRKTNAATIAFWTMLALELFYVLGICGIYYYKNRSKKEHGPSSEATQTDENKNDNVVRLHSDANKSEEEILTDNEAVAEEPNKANKIGFRQHGSVFIPDGSSTPHVHYQTKKELGQNILQQQCGEWGKRKQHQKLGKMNWSN